MKIKNLIKVGFVLQPEKFGYDATKGNIYEYWEKIKPLIHNEVEPDTFKISNDIKILKDWLDFYAEQIKDILQT